MFQVSIQNAGVGSTIFTLPMVSTVLVSSGCTILKRVAKQQGTVECPAKDALHNVLHLGEQVFGQHNNLPLLLNHQVHNPETAPGAVELCISEGLGFLIIGTGL